MSGAPALYYQALQRESAHLLRINFVGVLQQGPEAAPDVLHRPRRHEPPAAVHHIPQRAGAVARYHGPCSRVSLLERNAL